MKSKKLLLVLASTALMATSCFGNGGKSSSSSGSGSVEPSSSALPSSSSGDESINPSSSSSAAPSSSSSSSAPSSSSSSSAPSSSSSDPSSSSSDPVGPSAEPATGAFTYAKASNADRTEILGVLEKWAVDNKLTGLTLFEDGGYVMYSPLVEKGAPNYIKGYGWGTLAEGRLTGPLTGEEEANYQMYYHTYTSRETDNLIYMDDDTSITELSYIAGGYYDIIMNSTRTGYKWVGDLARNNEPVAVDPDEDGASVTYRVPVKTGADLKYSTLTTNATLAAFNNRQVALDDYLTPYKIYYTKAYGMKRNAEVKDANKGSIKGGDAYVKASAEKFDEAEFAKLGIKVGNNDELGDYIEFTFNEAYTPFWARYYISSSMFAPVPADFIKALGNGDFEAGLKLWGKWSEDTSLSPKDTYLSTGAYITEEWVKDKKHTFKRNPNYVSGEDVETERLSSYNIQGVYLSILKALSSDTEAALKEFLADKLHAVTIPSKKIKEYANDPRTTIVPGDYTTKLNFNTCDQESWEDLFGEAGSITQTPANKYWKLKPAMSNAHFLDGISYAFDRKTFAANLGATPSNDYFGSAYYSDAEEGIFYNDTDAHKRAVADSLAGTDGYGFSKEKATAAFALAAEEMIDNGDYEVGDTIEIELAWMAESQKDNYETPIIDMITAAFNDANTGLNLEFKHWYAPAGKTTDVYYNKMMVGQFDIAYGGVEGNVYDPLNFMEVLKSDNSSTFTLNWGIPTNEKVELEWDGKLWTYDALWEVADHGGYVEGGKNVATFDAKGFAIARDASGNVSIDLKILTKDVENFKTSFLGLCIFGTTNNKYTDYTELYLLLDGTVATDIEGGNATAIAYYFPDAAGSIVVGDAVDADGYVSIKVTLNAAFIEAFYSIPLLAGGDEAFSEETVWYRLGFDIYKAVTLFGVTGDPICHTSFYVNEGLPAIPAA